ncbi:uridine diphosphate glucose pyrophosphatase-like isoform X1 [Lingula anatina]|uniref:Uridine diphosphate glucose pyrophosphatase NUDT14 n=1 Tax=Lingula anatina TaxID=7574 RepID=A0A1S3IYT4_LINAN|nr:uridine diphosphate glucose pyrophosphatase-like isoform X1 [Lingula anatina]XP_013420384.1 uridine diphosphate glucose pyrophosphatase-like isoform X1 [Lingula anatina]|eukprot:XP_013402709.1 uridine diphosphate glucose pyrophosphatase-like isoform X1 [Lingula anatina]
MDNVTDVTVSPCSDSAYIKPLRVFYKQNGVSKTWDAVKSHDSVCILLFNKSTESFVFVKQFRPAIYIQKSELQKHEDHWKIDTGKYPGELGITYELCAGIVDKDKNLDVIAQEEILEECGFQVPLEKLQRITSYRSGEGTIGAQLTLYYAEVCEEVRITEGGGNLEEGEMIELIEVLLKDIKHWIMNESISKPATLMFAVMWFLDNKTCDTNSSS